MKAQAVRAMGTVATKLGGTINPQVILFMLKGAVCVNSSESLCSLIHNGNLKTNWTLPSTYCVSLEIMLLASLKDCSLVWK